MAEIFEFVLKKIEDTDDDYALPLEFNEFLSDNAIKTDEDRSWHEYIYNLILHHIPSKQSSFLSMDILSSVSEISNFKPILSSQEYKVKVRKVKNFEDDIKVLNALMDAEEDMLKSYGKISGLWGGLAVLIYACIAGIIIPSLLLLYLPYPIGYYDDSATKTMLLVLFISELIVLFAYLGFSMYRLTKHD